MTPAVLPRQGWNRGRRDSRHWLSFSEQMGQAALAKMNVMKLDRHEISTTAKIPHPARQAMIAADHADAALAAFVARVAPRAYFRDELADIRDLFEATIRCAAYDLSQPPVDIEALAIRHARAAADLFERLPASRCAYDFEVRTALITSLSRAIVHALQAMLPKDRVHAESQWTR